MALKMDSMINKWMFYSVLFFVVSASSFYFKPLEPYHPKKTLTDVDFSYQLPSIKIVDYQHQNMPFLGKRFVGFKEAIAAKESLGQYKLVNSLGYMGKYQFGISALNFIGIKSKAVFLNNPMLQEDAFVALVSINKYKLADIIREYKGKTVDGVRITESGLLAAAHLGGAQSVRKFITSSGKKKFKDGYGTTIKSYLKRFAGYETHNIPPKEFVKIE